MHISPEQMEVYKRTARSRLQAEKAQCAQRREYAWKLAHRAADLLRSEFGVR